MYLVSYRVRTATIIFEVGAFCSEGVGERGRSYFAEFMNKTKCLERKLRTGVVRWIEANH
jgi:hypothetical protein